MMIDVQIYRYVLMLNVNSSMKFVSYIGNGSISARDAEEFDSRIICRIC